MSMNGDGVDLDHVLERQLSAAVSMNLFDEQPPYLNAVFRFQLESNTFDGNEFAIKAWKRVASVAVGATAVGNGALHGGGQEQLKGKLERRNPQQQPPAVAQHEAADIVPQAYTTADGLSEKEGRRAKPLGDITNTQQQPPGDSGVKRAPAKTASAVAKSASATSLALRIERFLALQVTPLQVTPLKQGTPLRLTKQGKKLKKGKKQKRTARRVPVVANYTPQLSPLPEHNFGELLSSPREGICPSAPVECPNEGCSAIHESPVAMNLHRSTCKFEQVARHFRQVECVFPWSCRCGSRMSLALKNRH
ncbi:hypothetical protein T484DRAFT_1778604, partial [Baffinella frigidus]